MRYAILSDIHGNVWALEAVLNDCKRRAVDSYINLGDTIYGPLEPQRTWELLNSIPCFSINGNQDRDIFEAGQKSIITDQMKRVLKNINRETIDDLSKLPFTMTIDYDLFLCHGTPKNDSEYLLEDISSGAPIIKPVEEIVPKLEKISVPVILCGHSHLPHVVSLPDNRTVINPGSVGLQAYSDDLPCFHKMENYTTHASYAIAEILSGKVTVEFIRVPYDYDKAALCAAKQGRLDWEYAIRTGRAL